MPFSVVRLVTLAACMAMIFAATMAFASGTGAASSISSEPMPPDSGPAFLPLQAEEHLGKHGGAFSISSEPMPPDFGPAFVPLKAEKHGAFSISSEPLPPDFGPAFLPLEAEKHLGKHGGAFSISAEPKPPVSWPLEAEERLGKQMQNQIQPQIEEDYIDWDPTPYFGGSDPAPIPHAPVTSRRKSQFSAH